ncbi:MAG: DEAD/DEAH box helicase, partial [bacterium]|nr:DEAD/DEAH box helicase [bacterium]
DVLYKANVVVVSADKVEISLRNKHAQIDDHVDGAYARINTHESIDKEVNGDEVRRWVVEQDASDTTLKRTYGCVAMWMRAPSAKRQMLLGQLRPVFEDYQDRSGSRNSIPHARRAHALHDSIRRADSIRDEQRDIINRALSARDFFLVQGPPGTGKTSTILRSIVTELLLRPEERLLVLAYTNRAADEICTVLRRYVGEGVLLRHGSRDGARGDDSVASLLAQHTPSDAARILSECKCIVSTVSSAINQSDIFSFGDFTTAIVDEASQVLEPMLTGLLAQTGRFILIGDVCQLPAVVSQPADGLVVQAPMLRDICFTSLGMSMFERLHRVCVKNGWHDAYADLTHQGRMHKDVQAFPSNMFYGGRLEPLAPWQESSEPWITSSDNYLARVLETRATFIPIDDTDQQLREATLATRLAKQILVDAHTLGIEASIGIITPFRAQNNLVLQMLHDEERRHISVDTVERFQGSERDVIIYAVSAASMADMQGIASEITLADGIVVDRKLNVALTRAKQHIIVIGNPRFLRASKSYDNLIDHLTVVVPSSYFRCDIV